MPLIPLPAVTTRNILGVFAIKIKHRCVCVLFGSGRKAAQRTAFLHSICIQSEERRKPNGLGSGVRVRGQI